MATVRAKKEAIKTLASASSGDEQRQARGRYLARLGRCSDVDEAHLALWKEMFPDGHESIRATQFAEMMREDAEGEPDEDGIPRGGFGADVAQVFAQVYLRRELDQDTIEFPELTTLRFSFAVKDARGTKRLAATPVPSGRTFKDLAWSWMGLAFLEEPFPFGFCIRCRKVFYSQQNDSRQLYCPTTEATCFHDARRESAREAAKERRAAAKKKRGKKR